VAIQLLTRDFIEFIECCARHEVRFLVVGGYALAAHGHPRATEDVDVWIMIDPSNAERLVHALEDFGMGSIGLSPQDFLEPEVVIQLRIRPSASTFSRRSPASPSTNAGRIEW
jgi:hypothetical protein